MNTSNLSLYSGSLSATAMSENGLLIKGRHLVNVTTRGDNF